LYPERTFATADHNTPINQHLPVEDPYLQINYEALEENAKNTASATGEDAKKRNRSLSVLKTELHYLVQL
jgi:3-isopropylmalate/(R)-2-methylmalate dehydratase large subunit